MSRCLTAPASHESLIKRSRFIAHAETCPTETQARDFLKRISDPTATHNCWAWRSGDQYRFDDDGEPGGTAGRPILAAIEGQDMDQVAVVVIRYYGGIKLGTGGLIRAYGGTAAECLRTASSEPIIKMARLHCSVPFETIALIHQLLQRHQAIKLDENYTSTGVKLTLELPASDLDSFTEDLSNATSGVAKIRFSGN
jgi:uncharacterized YigZ family protein